MDRTILLIRVLDVTFTPQSKFKLPHLVQLLCVALKASKNSSSSFLIESAICSNHSRVAILSLLFFVLMNISRGRCLQKRRDEKVDVFGVKFYPQKRIFFNFFRQLFS